MNPITREVRRISKCAPQGITQRFVRMRKWSRAVGGAASKPVTAFCSVGNRCVGDRRLFTRDEVSERHLSMPC